MRIADCEITALDFECTGTTDPAHDNLPWQIGIAVMVRGKVVPERSFQSLLHVPVDHPFNPYTPGRWARQREALAAAPAMIELWPQLRPLLTGRPLLAHHTPTERGMLQQLFPLQSFGPWVDSLTIARRAFPGRSDYKLENLIPNLGLSARVQERAPGGAAHDAYYDAMACATLLEHVLTAPGWHDATVEALSGLK